MRLQLMSTVCFSEVDNQKYTGFYHRASLAIGNLKNNILLVLWHVLHAVLHDI